MLPAPLHPTDTLPLPLAHRLVHVPLCRACFTAAPLVDSIHRFGGKDFFLVEGRPQLAGNNHQQGLTNGGTTISPGLSDKYQRRMP